MTLKLPLYVSGLLATSLLGASLGCSQLQHSGTTTTATTPADDGQITSAIQSRLYADPAIQTKQISVQASNGVVTLGGAVGSEAERTAASAAAAGVAGVRTVVNNLTVAPSQPVQKAAVAPVAAPSPVERHHSVERRAAPRSYPKPSSDYAPAPVVAQAAPVAPVAPAPVVQAAPAPPPAPVRVTVEQGTTLSVRLVDSLDSESAQPGQTFRATMDSPLAVDGNVVVPEGYDVQGHVVDVKSAGKFAGKSMLSLQLDRIQVGTKFYTITTNQYLRQGNSRTTNTAEKVGAGAIIGAIIGGIAGGGKGAAIGTAAGGGLGGGVQAATKGQQIKLPSETVLTFSLQAPLTVTPTSLGRNSARPKLEVPSDNNPGSAPSNPPPNPPNR